jgi:uncharacterized membrane protein
MEWDLFIGRFHSLLVHLPIGIFLLGYFLEILFQFGFRKLSISRSIIIFIYAIGLLAGIFAAVTGWLLSFSDDYAIDALNNHKLLGIATLVVMLCVIIYQIKTPETKSKLKFTISTLAIILTGLTGHFGGNLTHGSNYLFEYGPNSLSAYEDVNLNRLKLMTPDSVRIFGDILHPIIQNNCVACHNSENYKGGLILESYSDLFKEAAYAVPVVAGKPYNSEFFSRVNLPTNDEKAMPPRGSGFSYTDIEILKYWIENGADSLATFNSDLMSDELILLINRDYGLDYKPKPYYEKVKVDSISNDLFNQLRRAEFSVQYLSKTNFLLDVSFKGDSITKEQVESLNQVANHITFLDLSDSSLSENLIETFTDMKHLNKVNFSKNILNTNMILFLQKHKNLESANLNSTDLTSSSLKSLLEQLSLKRVYVLDTKITEDELITLKQMFEKTEIISGFKFEKVIEAKSVFYEEKSDR